MPQSQQGQSEGLSFQQFEYSHNNADMANNLPNNEYQDTYSSGTIGSKKHDLPDTVTWESVKRAFSTGGYPDEPPLLEGILIYFDFKKDSVLITLLSLLIHRYLYVYLAKKILTIFCY